MPNTWVIIAILLAWLGSLAVATPTAYRHGRHVEGVERDSRMLEAVEKAVGRANELAAADYAEAARAFGIALNRQKRAEASATIVEHSVATKTEYRNCILDAEDLANLNEALGGY